MKDFSFVRSFPDLISHIGSAQQVAYTNMNLAAVSYRSALEALVDRFLVLYRPAVYSSNPERPPSLNDKVKALEAVLPELTIKYMHRVKSIGNQGAHPNQKGPVQVKDINRADDALFELCAYYVNTLNQAHTRQWQTMSQYPAQPVTQAVIGSERRSRPSQRKSGCLCLCALALIAPGVLTYFIFLTLL